MKYKQALLGAFLALTVTGSIQRCMQRETICVDSNRIDLGAIEFTVHDAASKLPILFSVGLGSVSNRELFRSAISFREDGGVRIVYVTDEDRYVTISAEGFESRSFLISSLKARTSIALTRIEQK